ncbi:MAG: hypothetical protein HFE75_02780 [Firmicutes bacterium]|jgi:hypothetical protein|nr:hypothetical protein [Bacillota bacterium]NBI63389.1 hypothetical protein [Clostridiales bacterium]
MGKFFNVTAVCRLRQHYMVDIMEKLERIKAVVVQGQYFTMNCARQYGKTTTLKLLEKFLKDDYLVSGNCSMGCCSWEKKFHTIHSMNPLGARRCLAL